MTQHYHTNHLPWVKILIIHINNFIIPQYQQQSHLKVHNLSSSQEIALLIHSMPSTMTLRHANIKRNFFAASPTLQSQVPADETFKNCFCLFFILFLNTDLIKHLSTKNVGWKKLFRGKKSIQDTWIYEKVSWNWILN